MKKTTPTGLVGIMFIIFIITLALILFFIQSISNEDKIIYGYQQSQLASNTIYALMKTTVKCDGLICSGNKLGIDELVKNCIGNGECALVENKIEEYLDYTFMDKGINYKFKASYNGEDYFEIKQGICREKRTEYFFMPLEYKNIQLSMEVC